MVRMRKGEPNGSGKEDGGATETGSRRDAIIYGALLSGKHGGLQYTNSGAHSATNQQDRVIDDHESTLER